MEGKVEAEGKADGEADEEATEGSSVDIAWKSKRLMHYLTRTKMQSMCSEHKEEQDSVKIQKFV
jgi:hypothetical protein